MHAITKAPPALRDLALVLNDGVQTRFDLMNSLFGSYREYKIDTECGYPVDITPQLYKHFYLREGIAARVVGIYPDECWTKKPVVYDTDDAKNDSDFEVAFANLDSEFHILSYLHRIDELSGIGRFGILLLGVDDGRDLDEPLAGVGEDGKPDGSNPQAKLLYLRPFDESLVLINQFNVDPTSPRYGKPLFYSINFIDATQWGTVSPIGAESLTMKRVHWSRVIHVAEKTSSSEIFGLPRMQNVFNRLYDLKKIQGGSPEMFWKGGFPGLSLEVNPELQDVELDRKALDKEMYNYFSGLRRYLALTGVSAKSLAPQIADPTPHYNLQLAAIAVSLRCPLRVFTGTEQGVLAGSQDALAWANRVSFRRENHIDPQIIKPVCERLVACGVLPPPSEDEERTGVKVDWKNITAPDEKTQAEILLAKTQAVAAYIQGSVDNLIPPVAYFEQFCGMSHAEAEAMVEAAEKFLGASLDDVAAQELDQKLNPPMPEVGGFGAPPSKPVSGPSGTSKKPANAKSGKKAKKGKKPVKNEMAGTNEQAIQSVVDNATAMVEHMAKVDLGDRWTDEFAQSRAARRSYAAIENHVNAVETGDTSVEAFSSVINLHEAAASKLRAAGCRIAARWHSQQAIEVASRLIRNNKDTWENQPRNYKGEWTKTGGIYGVGGVSKKHTGFIPVKLVNPDADGDKRKYIVAPGHEGKVPAHTKDLGLPPAWTGVMVNPDPKGHLQAVGIDSTGWKVQPRYRKEFIEGNKSDSFANVDKLYQKGHIKRIRADNETNLNDKSERIRQHAAALKLIMDTGMRPGGLKEGDVGIGAIDLKGKHVTAKGSGAVISYIPGKKGGQRVKVSVSGDTAKLVLSHAKKAGPLGRLFPTVDQNTMLNYTKHIGNGKYTTKDFRTYKGTETAASYIAKNPFKGKTEKDYKKWLGGVATHVSGVLNNTPAIALKKYISPSVIPPFKK